MLVPFARVVVSRVQLEVPDTCPHCQVDLYEVGSLRSISFGYIAQSAALAKEGLRELDPLTEYGSYELLGDGEGTGLVELRCDNCDNILACAEEPKEQPATAG